MNERASERVQSTATMVYDNRTATVERAHPPMRDRPILLNGLSPFPLFFYGQSTPWDKKRTREA